MGTGWQQRWCVFDPYSKQFHWFLNAEAEDLEDVVPDKAHRLKIVEAAKEAMISNPTAKSGARQDYGRVLGHDRDD